MKLWRMEQDADTLKIGWLLVGLTAVVYWTVSGNEFINYDDALFVFQNPRVYTGLTAANAKWAFTTLSGHATSYQPLTWLTHQMDCQFFGMRPGAHHITNLWFHIANTVLLFRILHNLTGKPLRAAMVAALFSLHPLHVETVAWISERKSLVCSLFCFLTILAYARYVRRAGLGRYLLVLVLFTAALLCKPIAVSLPITLLLLDFWPLRRWRGHSICPWGEAQVSRGAATAQETPCGPQVGRPFGFLLVEKLPLFFLSGLACMVTLAAQTDLGATKSLEDVPMSVRLSNSVVACALYLRKLVWPADLAPIYPLRHDWPGWQVAGCALVLLSISIWAVFQARKRPYLLVVWGWYLVTLFPTLGLVQVGSQGMADRYTYLPLIGIFVFLVWEASEQARGLRFAKPTLGFGAAAVTAALALCTMATLRNWQNSTVLFEHALAVTKDNYIAYRQLGMARVTSGDLQSAESCYRESLRIQPKQAATEAALGDLLRVRGNLDGALDHYSAALKTKQAEAGAHRKLAELYLGSTDARFQDAGKALEHARRACELTHYNNRDALTLLAQACVENRQLNEAADAAEKALGLSVSPQEIQGAKNLIASISRKASATVGETTASAAQTQ